MASPEIARHYATPAKTPVIIDLKIDLAGIDSTTSTVLLWKSTKFSDNVLAHYFLYAIDPVPCCP